LSSGVWLRHCRPALMKHVLPRLASPQPPGLRGTPCDTPGTENSLLHGPSKPGQASRGHRKQAQWAERCVAALHTYLASAARLMPSFPLPLWSRCGEVCTGAIQHTQRDKLVMDAACNTRRDPRLALMRFRSGESLAQGPVTLPSGKSLFESA
jgi:hypothetical protein